MSATRPSQACAFVYKIRSRRINDLISKRIRRMKGPSPMAEILLVGKYRFLLECRSAVLRQTCSRTHCTDEYEIAKLASQQIDLAILCHSLPVERRNALCLQIRRLWPGVRILQVVPTLLDLASARDYADATASSLNPDELVAIAAKLLGNPTTHRSRESRHT